MPGLVNLFAIEIARASPPRLALAEEVEKRPEPCGQPRGLMWSLEAMTRVASIGECMIELRHRSASALELAFGGDTLNTAVYLARLTNERGVRVDYVTALGDDAYSDAMLAMWQDEGIGTDLVARLPGRLPGLYTIRTDARGERSFTYWRSASAAREMLRGPRAEQLPKRSQATTCSTSPASRSRSSIRRSARR